MKLILAFLSILLSISGLTQNVGNDYSALLNVPEIGRDSVIHSYLTKKKNIYKKQQELIVEYDAGNISTKDSICKVA